MHVRRGSGRSLKSGRKRSSSGVLNTPVWCCRNVCLWLGALCLGFIGLMWLQLSVLHQHGDGQAQATEEEGGGDRKGGRGAGVASKAIPHELEGVKEREELAQLERSLADLQRRKVAIDEAIMDAEDEAENLLVALEDLPTAGAAAAAAAAAAATKGGANKGNEKRYQLPRREPPPSPRNNGSPLPPAPPPSLQSEAGLKQEVGTDRREIDNGGKPANDEGDSVRSGGGKTIPGMALFEEGAQRPVLTQDPLLVRRKLPLVVGGTDGSGTRSVVAMLQRLGVPMVVEDGGTLDVHGQYMAKGGWPAVVRPVLQQAHSTAYDVGSISRGTYDETAKAITTLKAKMVQKSTAVASSAGMVEWGLKAPVSILLVPFFAAVWGGVRFVHVVRDGRDIAFSGNQSPVVKFYEDTYPKPDGVKLAKEVKAIRLWSDWNGNIYDWAASHRDGSTVDYLLLHTEDLLSDPPIKFAALKDMAEFVGSSVTDDQLCCMAHEKAKDMGSHSNRKEAKMKVTERFGKWKKKVEGNTKLEDELHDKGARSLRLFGYEPPRALRVTVGYDCSKPPAQSICSTVPAEPSYKRSVFRGKIGGAGARTPRNTRMKLKVPTKVSDTAECNELKMDWDLKGADLFYVTAEDHLECCKYCRKQEKCTSYALDYKFGLCYLKTDGGTPTAKKNILSGRVVGK